MMDGIRPFGDFREGLDDWLQKPFREPISYPITKEESVEVWQREYERLEAMPKDKLIRMLIGERPL